MKRVCLLTGLQRFGTQDPPPIMSAILKTKAVQNSKVLKQNQRFISHMLNIPMHSQLGGEDDGEFSVKILYVVVEGAPFKHKGSFFI